jgi:hypothetical protein
MADADIALPWQNWQWDGQSSNLRVDPSRKREAASIQVKMTETSSLKYLVPMFATEAGYLAELRVYLNMITVASSLNDTKLLDAKSYSVSGSTVKTQCND